MAKFYRFMVKRNSILANVVVIFILPSLFPPSYSYNVDFNHPIIITNSLDGPESYFGATVQLFSKNENVSWVVIGAPRANSSYPIHANIVEPGVVWRCSLGRVQDYCAPLIMDPTGDGFYQAAVADRKQEGWLGGSLSDANSERFVTCASRWVNDPSKWKTPQEKDYKMAGICYWRPKTQILEDSVPPLPSNYRLLPLRPVPQLPETFKHQVNFTWNLGQAGFSAFVSKENTLIMGAPGVNTWKGTVIQYLDGSGPSQIPPSSEGDTLSNSFAKSLVVNSTLLGSWLKNDSYFGYAVASGSFFKPSVTATKIQYVAAAPRGDNLNGQVVLFNFPEDDTKPIEKLSTLTGKQIGSYFGATLCIEDINGDGLDDLLVGAPRFTSPVRAPKLTRAVVLSSVEESTELPPLEVLPDAAPETGGTDGSDPKSSRLLVKLPNFSSGDEGAVYVYLSNGENLELKETLHGSSKAWSQFGSAIASAGDLNHDGFKDIVIGAPYEDEGRGCIYIYRGSERGLDQKYSQRIPANILDVGLRAFGYSLSRGVDVDNNGYNDLAVGSYASGQTVILRTRPSIEVTGRIQSSVKRLPLDIKTFKIISCVKYSGYRLPTTLTIGVQILMDIDSKVPRVLVRTPELDGSTSADLSYMEKASVDFETCTNLEGVVVRPLDQNLPVKIRQRVFLPDTERGNSDGRSKRSTPSDSTTYEIKSSDGNRISLDISGKGYKEFCSSCPVLSRPDVDLTTFSLPLEVLCGDDEKCTADLRINAGFPDIGLGDNFTIGSLPTLKLFIGVKNFKETAFAPAIEVSYTKRNLVRLPRTCEYLTVDSTKFNKVKCSLGQTLASEQDTNVLLEFAMVDLIAGSPFAEKEYIFRIKATTTSEMLVPAELDLLLPVNATADMSISANHDNILFSRTTLAQYQILSHTYDVRLRGPSPIAEVWLRFEVPTNLTYSEGSLEVLQVFYPQADLDGVDVFCRAANGIFQRSSSETSVSRRMAVPAEYMQPDPNFDAFLGRPSASRDGRVRDIRKRDISTIKPDSGTSIAREGTIFFACGPSFVQCMEIRCKLTNFKPNSRARVTINMRIASNMTRMLFAQKNSQALVIQTNGEIFLEEDFQLENTLPDRAPASTTILLDRAKPVSKLYIVAAIVIGILLLFAIIYSLYACGCLEKDKKIEEHAEEGEEEPFTEKMPGPLQVEPMELDPIDEEVEENMSEDSGPPPFVPSQVSLPR